MYAGFHVFSFTCPVSFKHMPLWIFGFKIHFFPIYLGGLLEYQSCWRSNNNAGGVAGVSFWKNHKCAHMNFLPGSTVSLFWKLSVMHPALLWWLTFWLLGHGLTQVNLVTWILPCFVPTWNIKCCAIVIWHPGRAPYKSSYSTR